MARVAKRIRWQKVSENAKENLYRENREEQVCEWDRAGTKIHSDTTHQDSMQRSSHESRRAPHGGKTQEGQGTGLGTSSGGYPSLYMCRL